MTYVSASYIVGVHTFHVPMMPGSNTERARVLNETTWMDNDASECDHQDNFPCYCVPSGLVVRVARAIEHTYTPDGNFVYCNVDYCETCLQALPF